MSINLQNTSAVIAYSDKITVIKSDGTRDEVERTFTEEQKISGADLPLPDGDSFKSLLKDSQDITFKSSSNFAQAFIGSAVSRMALISQETLGPRDNQTDQTLELESMLRHPRRDFHFAAREVWINPSKVTEVVQTPGRPTEYMLHVQGGEAYKCSTANAEVAKIVQSHQQKLEMAL